MNGIIKDEKYNIRNEKNSPDGINNRLDTRTWRQSLRNLKTEA